MITLLSLRIWNIKLFIAELWWTAVSYSLRIEKKYIQFPEKFLSKEEKLSFFLEVSLKTLKKRYDSWTNWTIYCHNSYLKKDMLEDILSNKTSFFPKYSLQISNIVFPKYIKRLKSNFYIYIFWVKKLNPSNFLQKFIYGYNIFYYWSFGLLI